MADDAEGRLARIAQDVAEGTPVDWERELDGADVELSRRLHHLRVVARIHETHRSEDPDRFPSAPDDDHDDYELLDAEDLIATAPPRRWGSLEIIAPLGGGGFGEVYRARDPALQTDVALKLLHRDQTGDDPDAFLAEARKLARVRHPNVLTVHGAAEHDGRVGLWTELVDGRTLDRIVNQDGPLAPREAALVGIELCRALAAVHAAGIVHRDVKAANVMREHGGRIVLLDFSAGTDRDAPGRITTAGTPFYMPPEAFGGPDSGTAADVYSLGVLLFRLVSGRYPVEADGVSGLIEAHRRGESHRLLDVRPDTPSAYARVVERALQPAPGDRYATVGEMEAELDAFLGGSQSDRRRSSDSWWRRPTIAAPIAAAVLVVALAGAWVASNRSASLDVEASWLRIRGKVEERLLPGARIHPGDCLELEIEGTRGMHVYVVNEARYGSTPYVLFPNPSFHQANPLPRGRALRLPGTTDAGAECWAVSSHGGTETMLVVASIEPLPEVERELAGMPLAGSAMAFAAGNDELVSDLRGVGGLRPRTGGRDGGALDELTGSLSRYGTRDDGVWVWELLLDSGEP